MFNKFQGYVCFTDDFDYLTVFYFFDESVAWKLYAAGRLDIDIIGLVLMIDDGQWSYRIIFSRYYCEKIYLVILELFVVDDTVE